MLFVHGVGPFSPDQFQIDLAPVMAQFGETVSWQAFDWSALAGDPISRLQEVGLGAVRTMLVESRGGAPRSQISRLCSAIYDQLCWLLYLTTMWFPLFALVLSFQARFLGPYALAIAGLAVTTFVVGCLSSLDVWQPLRRVGVAVLWPLIHFCGAPLLLIEADHTEQFVGALGSASIFGMPILGLFYFLDSVSFKKVFSEPMIGGATLGHALIVFGTICAALLIVKVFADSRFGNTLRWIVKVSADVLRYVGVPNYRSRLLDAFEHLVIAQSSRGQRLIIVAHSLGSAIALDALTRLPALVSSKDVVLVTMGSPTRRLLFRFFPGIFCDPNAAGELLASKARTFLWLNIYRRFDPVGTSITGRQIRNIKLNDSTFGPGAHTNYWTDPKVISAVNENIAVPLAMAQSGVPLDAHVWFDSKEVTVRLRGLGWLLANLETVARVSAVAALLFGSIHFLRLYRQSRWSESRTHQVESEKLERLHAHGLHTTGLATCVEHMVMSHRPDDQGMVYTTCVIEFQASMVSVGSKPFHADRLFEGELELHKIDVWYDPADPGGFSFDQDPNLKPHPIRWAFDDFLMMLDMVGGLALLYGGILIVFLYPWIRSSGGGTTALREWQES